MSKDYYETLGVNKGASKNEVKILKESVGMLKNRLKKSPVSYQRELRKELERK